MSISAIFLIAALIIFILAALPRVNIGGVNLVPLGLACVTLAMILGAA